MIKELLLLFPALFSLIWFILILARIRRTHNWLVLLAFFFCLFVTFICWWMFCISKGSVAIDILAISTSLSLAPLYYTYMSRQLGIESIRVDMVLVLSTLTIVAANVIVSALMGAEEGAAYLDFISTRSKIPATADILWKIKKTAGSYSYRILFALQSIFVIGWSSFNTHGNSNLKRINRITMVLSVTTLSFSMIDYSDYANSGILQLILALLMSISVIQLGIFIMFKYDEVQKDNHKIVKPELEINTADTLQYRLEKALEDKIWCDPSLSLSSLAESLKTNRTYLSDMINRRYGKSFTDLIAEKRINNAIELLKSGNTVIKSVALNSGYQTMSTFYRNFASVTGRTVPEWMKENGLKGGEQ